MSDSSSSVSGACIVSKVSGMVYIREDVTPSILEWKAIEQQKTITLPLNSLVNLQATKESSPKMILKVIYKLLDDPQEKDIRLTFNNRPTMNNIKDHLQTIVSRQRTVVKDGTSDSNSNSNSNVNSPAPTGRSPTPGAQYNTNGDTRNNNKALNFTDHESLSDTSLLKNHQLQQKLLLEEKNLRNVFTQAVINYKLSPNVFWSTRLNQLRTYALTISQHRGPYNVLSTIKPVASSDNKVNVNVTRSTINEIFDTYPIIKKAFTDLVPVKFQEGEFWSRFFNSKLFRRLRGDKINNSNERGDMVLDKYLYVDSNYFENNNNNNDTDPSDGENKRRKSPDHLVNRVIDLQGNEEDNSQKMGNKPDITMRFADEMNKLDMNKKNDKSSKPESEMVILMKNMNNLSSKMVSINQETSADSSSTADNRQLSERELNEAYDELDLHDLNDDEQANYIDLNINNGIGKYSNNYDELSNISNEEISQYCLTNIVRPQLNGINLIDTYTSKEAIDQSASEITSLIKQNFKAFKLANNSLSSESENILSDSMVQDIITLNITVLEFLSHFWTLFLSANNPGQLKKIFASLKNCKSSLQQLKEKITTEIYQHPNVVNNPKLKEKLSADLNYCLSPIQIGLDKALSEYAKAVKEQSNGTEINENGKRPIES